MKNLIGLCVMVAFVAALTVSSLGCGGSATTKSTTVSSDKNAKSTEVKADPPKKEEMPK
ncbi:MAG: hypothetical protein JNM56_35250 [Planctomycetia bacterium]|nr:hypothetical protein [Planctomycetia bacterium]